jgi:hypothetical protein
MMFLRTRLESKMNLICFVWALFLAQEKQQQALLLLPLCPLDTFLIRNACTSSVELKQLFPACFFFIILERWLF